MIKEIQLLNKIHSSAGHKKFLKVKSRKVLTNSFVCCIISIEVNPRREQMADKFIKIPCSIILDKELGEKRIISFASIVFSNWSGTDYESLAQFSLYSGFRGKDGIIHQYKELVQHFIDGGYFNQLDGGMVYIDQDEQFGIIYYSEFQKILKLRSEYKEQGRRLNHANILLLLAYLRLYMNHGRRKPEYYSNLLIRISKNTGLSVRSISSSLKALEELEIIHNEELPRYKSDDGNWHSNVRIFVNMKKRGTISYDWQREVSKGIWHINASQID